MPILVPLISLAVMIVSAFLITTAFNLFRKSKWVFGCLALLIPYFIMARGCMDYVEMLLK